MLYLRKQFLRHVLINSIVEKSLSQTAVLIGVKNIIVTNIAIEGKRSL